MTGQGCVGWVPSYGGCFALRLLNLSFVDFFNDQFFHLNIFDHPRDYPQEYKVSNLELQCHPPDVSIHLLATLSCLEILPNGEDPLISGLNEPLSNSRNTQKWNGPSQVPQDGPLQSQSNTK